MQSGGRAGRKILNGNGEVDIRVKNGREAKAQRSLRAGEKDSLRESRQEREAQSLTLTAFSIFVAC